MTAGSALAATILMRAIRRESLLVLFAVAADHFAASASRKAMEAPGLDASVQAAGTGVSTNEILTMGPAELSC
jgi:hypothetical protein